MAKLRPKPADAEAYSKNGKKSEQREGKQEVYQRDCKPGIDLLGGVANKFSNNVKLLTNLTLRNTVIRVYALSWIDPFPTPSSNFLL